MIKAKKSTCKEYAMKPEGQRPNRICLLARSVLTKFSAVIVVLVVSACATRSMEHVDQYMAKADQPQFNSIIESDGGQFFSFGKVIGPAENPLEPGDLSRAMGFDIDGMSVTIWDPKPVASDYALPGFFDADAAWHDDSVQAALQTMRATLAPMKALTRTKTAINVVVAPAGSGLWVRQPLDFAMDGTETWFMVGYPYRQADRQSAMRLWAEILGQFGRHVMRLQQLRKWPGGLDEQRRIDFETAAGLSGWCATARFGFFTSSGGSFRATLRGPRIEIRFPGISQGAFSPNLDAFRGHNPQYVGEQVAAALIFHLFFDGGGVVELADLGRIGPVLRICDRLSSEIPFFSRGETGL